VAVPRGGIERHTLAGKNLGFGKPFRVVEQAG
jgi:hypothetical protein